MQEIWIDEPISSYDEGMELEDDNTVWDLYEEWANEERKYNKD